MASRLSNSPGEDTSDLLSGKSVLEEKKKDQEITSLIKKDITRTMQELSIFHDPTFSQNLQQILFIWAKENSEYKY